jgi:hypothetical protein
MTRKSIIGSVSMSELKRIKSLEKRNINAEPRAIGSFFKIFLTVKYKKSTVKEPNAMLNSLTT